MEKLDVIKKNNDLQVYVNINKDLLVKVNSFDDLDGNFYTASIGLCYDDVITLRNKLDEYLKEYKTAECLRCKRKEKLKHGLCYACTCLVPG